MKKLFLSLIVLLAVAAPVGAVTYIATDGWAFGQNTDVDTLGEVLVSDGPTKCEDISVCNSLLGGDVVYVGYSSSALTYGAGTTLATDGFALYPTAASGETCTPPGMFTAHKNYTGNTVYANTRYIWVYAAGINSKVSWACKSFKN